jgi:cytochrome c5
MNSRWRSLGVPAFVGLAAFIAACQNKPANNPQNGGSSATASVSRGGPSSTTTTGGESMEVLLCDGKTKVSVPAGTPGTTIAGSLMSEWLAKHPGSTWEAEERERHTLVAASDNAGLVDPKLGPNETTSYGRFSAQDIALWKTETERVATAGSMVFHNAEQLGSTVGVSCDMCHPHAANTHPETYPKFQVQLGRVALLRDMINWCIEHPVRGKAMSSDDPRMRALEAYIIAQRKGKTLEYGKH